MAATRKPRKTTPAPARHLLEWAAASPAGNGPALDIDREKQVIYGVRVLGRFSRNQTEAEGGREYTPDCMRDALRLYEGCEVLVNHDFRQKRDKNEAEGLIGVLRNPRLDGDCIRADLHYYTTHPMAGRLLEDIEKRIGALGLSHDASNGPADNRFDHGRKVLVVNRLRKVHRVDVVRNPATNTNFWESAPVTKTLRELLESLTLSKPRQKWRRRLLEDDAAADMLDAPMEAEPAAGEEGSALWDGFWGEITAIGEKYKAGEMDARAAGKAVMKYLKAHESLMGDDEPGDPPADDADAGDGADEGADKKESLSPAEKQELGVRRLCEELKVAPPKGVLAAAIKLPTLKDARELLESLPAGGTGAKPRSPGHPGGGGAAAKPAAVPTDAKGFGASVRDDR